MIQLVHVVTSALRRFGPVMVRSHDFRPPLRKASFRCVCSSSIRARLSIGTRHPTALVRERARINPVTWLIPRTSNVRKLTLDVREDLRCQHARVMFLCACTMLFGKRHSIQLGGAGGVGGAGCSRECRPAVFVKSRCGSAKRPSGRSGGAIRKRAWWADVTGRFEADPFACSMFTAPVALYGPRCATTGLATADNGFGPCPLRCCAQARSPFTRTPSRRRYRKQKRPMVRRLGPAYIARQRGSEGPQSNVLFIPTLSPELSFPPFHFTTRRSCILAPSAIHASRSFSPPIVSFKSRLHLILVDRTSSIRASSS